jgi:hypothetical protein
MGSFSWPVFGVSRETCFAITFLSPILWIVSAAGVLFLFEPILLRPLGASAVFVLTGRPFEASTVLDRVLLMVLPLAASPVLGLLLTGLRLLRAVAIIFGVKYVITD